MDNVRPDRQTVMFSATFPRAMEALARRILAKPIEVQVGGRSVVCSDVEQHVVSPLTSYLHCFYSTPLQTSQGSQSCPDGLMFTLAFPPFASVAGDR